MQQAGEARGEQRCEGVRADFSAERRTSAVGKVGSYGEIDSETYDYAISRPLEQDSGELSSKQQQIVRPFEHQRLRGDRRVDRLDQRKSGDQRESLGGRVRRAELHQRASVEIARRRAPAPALPPLPRLLLERDQPVALVRLDVIEQVGVGRAGPFDNPDFGQKALFIKTETLRLCR
jgi:hypothetical protein